MTSPRFAILISFHWAFAQGFGGKSQNCQYLMAMTGTITRAVDNGSVSLDMENVSNTYFWTDRPCRRVQKTWPMGIVETINRMANSTDGAPNAVVTSAGAPAFIEIRGASLLSNNAMRLSSLKNINENGNSTFLSLMKCIGCEVTLVIDDVFDWAVAAGIIATLLAALVLCFTIGFPECPIAMMSAFDFVIGTTSAADIAAGGAELADEIAFEARGASFYSYVSDFLESLSSDEIEADWSNFIDDFNLDDL